MPLMVQGVGLVPAIPFPLAGGSEDLASRDMDGSPEHRLPRQIDIGLLNNMPDSAFRATERQFTRQLAAASGAIDIRLHLFALPQVMRSAEMKAYIADRYRDASALAFGRLDAMIVTGAEPVAATLTDEPYWPGLARVVDWAEHNTVSTLWSCLAAHAAVLHLDGIARRRLQTKCFGLFECVKAADGGLLDGAPAGMRIPHSRWNDLNEGDLRQHGYRIVSRSLEAGIDTFTKQWGSLFVFQQGHPEYDVDTLFREYRRDAQRFLRGELDGLPALPSHYFDARTESGLQRFRELALAGNMNAWDAFPATWAIRPPQIDLWRASVRQFYSNWLRQIAEAKR